MRKLLAIGYSRLVKNLNSNSEKRMANGFTLMEVIVAIGLLALVSLLAGGVYLGQIRLFNRQNTQVDVISANQLILDDLVDEIRNASSVAASVTSGSDSYATGPDELVLQMIAIDQNGSLINNSFDHLVYYLSGLTTPKTLHKRLIPDPASSRQAYDDVKSVYVDNLVLGYDNLDPALATTIDISLTTVKKLEGKDKTTTTTTKAYLRNY